MIKEIKYNGYSANPSDYECADGDLSVAMNLIPEDGVLKGIQKPQCLFTLPQGKKVIYIHNISVYKHYIIYDTESAALQWLSSNDTDKQPEDIVSISGELYQVTSLGNTLIILTSEGIIYALYKSGTYVLMGSNPVFPSLSFRLRAFMGNSDMLSASFPGFNMVAFLGSFLLSTEASQAVRDTVLAYTNKCTADAKTAGSFQYPFMIRYAYRMYDGTLNYISPPVKICPSYGIPYLIHYTGYEMNNGLYTKFNMVVSYVTSRLYYEITNFDEVKESISEWGELVRSIDIFITPPLYTVDQDNMCKSISPYGFWGPLGGSGAFLEYCANSGNENVNGELIYRLHNARESINTDSLFFGMSGKSLVDDDSSLPFYLISSIDVKKIQSGENIVSIENGALNSLEAKEVMEGDSNLMGTIVAKHAFPYNARLNLTGVTIIPPTFPLESCFQYANGEYDNETKKAVEKTYSYKAYIFIEAEKRKVMVQFLSGIPMNIVDSYFFYPNINAKELIIERIDNNGVKSYSYSKLHKHETLNGVYGSINTSFSSTPDMSLITDTEIGIPYPNKIYTSDVNDPFSFPALGVCTVGTGTIIGLSSAAKALSQGQFGQFPLYCFSTDGIWALEVSSTGSYSARQPITRDVCINSDSITQIDNAVLFATDRGIMLISGSTSQCISDILDSELAFSINSLPHLNKLVNNTRFNSTEFQFLTFREFLKTCRMIYDYIHQRIIIHNPSCTYAYLYSMDSKQWGMMHSNIMSGLNSYPDALAMTSDNDLVNFSQPDNTIEPITALAVTRPFKIDDPNMFKTIDTIIQRGYFKSSHVSQVLYGSNDLFNWHAVWSSTDKYMRGFHGTPYKAFRLVLICKLDKSESLLGFTVQFTPRMLNKPR